MATDHNFKVKNGLTVQGETLVVNHTGDLSGTQVYIKRKDSSTNLQRWGEGTSGQSTYRWRIDQEFELIGNSGSGDKVRIKSADGSIEGLSYKIGSTQIIDSSRNFSNIGTISSGAITSSGTITAPTLIAGAYGAGGSAGDGFRINSTDIYGQIDSVDKVHISAVTGHIGVQSGHSVGKFAIMSTGVHNSYDFYNNGTSYFNGTTEVNAEFKISSSSSYITHFNYQDNGVNIISQANDGSTSIRNNNGNLFSLSSAGSLSVAGNVIAGSSSSAAIVRAHYSDGSYMSLEGFGLVMNRGASYIRPSTDGDKTLYIGGADASLDWASIRFRSTAGLYLNGTQFIDASRNLTNIGTISSGAITATNAIFSDTSSTGRGIYRNSRGYDLRLGGGTNSTTGAYISLSADQRGGTASSYNGRLEYHTGGIDAANANSVLGDHIWYADYNGGSTHLMTLDSVTGDLDVKAGDYKINGTSVIDSNRNLTNIGTLSAAGKTSIAASTSTSSSSALKLHVGTINNTSSSAIAQFGGFIRASDYYILHASAGSTDAIYIDYNGDDMDITAGEGTYSGKLRADGYKIHGTEVITSARSLTNINSLSLTSSITLNNNQRIYFKNSSGTSNSFLYRAGGNATRFEYADNAFIFDAASDTDFEIRQSGDAVVFKVDVQSTVANTSVYTTGNFNAAQNIQTGSTTRITNAGNLINIGSITASGNVQAQNATFTGTGDVTVKIIADTDNVTETDNPTLGFSQDGNTAGTLFVLGLEGNENTVFHGSKVNSPYIHANVGSANHPLSIGNNGKLVAQFNSTAASPALTVTKFSNITGTNGSTILNLKNYMGSSTTDGDLSQQKSFIDFQLLDSNANEVPQVRIGAEVGEGASADSQTLEGSGAFVVYTNDADTTSGDAGASLTEKFRVAHDGTSTFTNNVVIGGNLTVNGTQTTLNTATLQVEDKNIVLNYGTGDTSGSANGAGITIQDGVNATTDATILWNGSSDQFDFSHKINISGNLQSWNVYSQDFYVLNSAGNGWHKWGERSDDRINLSVHDVSANGTITISSGAASKITFTNSSDSNYNVELRTAYDYDGFFRVVDGGGVVRFAVGRDNHAYLGGTGGDGGNKVFHDGYHPDADNADTVDNLHASQFLRSDAADSATGALTFSGSILSQGHSSGDNWMPYTDGNFYFRAPNVFFDNNVEFNDEARVVTGSITSSNSTKGLMFDGNYQDGRYRHRLRKHDQGGGVPLYLDYAHSTANSYDPIVRFGSYTNNPQKFEVYGNARIDNLEVSSGGSTSSLTLGTYSTTDQGLLKLTGSTANKESVLRTTNGNLHIDSNTGNATYINYYTGSGTYFGTGASGVAAVMGPDGDLWKGSADNSGSKYWHAGNHGSGSGLDADTVDNLQASQFLRSDTNDTATGAINFTSTGLKLSGHFYTNRHNANGDVYFHVGTADSVANKLNLRVYDASNNFKVFYLRGDTGQILWDNNTIWHEGNDSGFLKQEGAAPSDLDSAGMGVFRINTGHSNQPASTNYGTLVGFNNNSDTGFQLASDYQGNRFYWRAGNSSNFGGSGSMSSWQRVFTDNYHPNADKWTTARTLSLTGDITGSVSWDGSQNVSMSTALGSLGNITIGTTTDSSKITFPDKNVSDNPGAVGDKRQLIAMGNSGAGGMWQTTGRGGLMLASADDSLILASGDVGRGHDPDAGGWNPNPDDENIYLLTDSAIYFRTNLQTTSAYKQMSFDANGDLAVSRNITASGTITASGNVQHTGLTMTSGTDIDQLYTVTDSLTITTSWQDTSINGVELSTGTYIIQVYAHDPGNGGSHYNEFYSGVISWYGAGTNSSEVDEIVLHRAGHAPNASVLHLRTQRHPSGGDNLVLQIKANYTRTAASNYTFKFRRMI